MYTRPTKNTKIQKVTRKSIVEFRSNLIVLVRK